MDGGFSFAGVNIGEIGLFYAPELETTYVYSPAEASIHEETFDGHNGGYFYGAWAQPKEFTLRCYFEMERIDMGIMAKIHNIFKVGRPGKLIFSRRPWCYYWARVSEKPTFDLKNYENGLVTIKMKAYFPFARSDTMTNLWTDNHHNEVMQNTALFDKAELVPATSLVSSTALTLSAGNESDIFILANPGTERAPVCIRIAGAAADGVEIKNYTTDETVKFVGLTKAITTNEGRYVACDAVNGKTVLTNGSAAQMAFLYHDMGFLTLEPSYPCLRNIHANYDTTTAVELVNRIEDDVTGQYIWLGEWIKITAQPDVNHLTLASAPSDSGYVQTTIMKMNELTIKAVGNIELTKLDFIYQPIFA